ncbi:MAG: DUF1854 domain-containing protein [Planctomycetes bacterium]|nr:DUF1854 domain-containing protein [Planctomycetota bacterium]NBY01372.1 DUF1854 domain-containing protein [Planctomycetota bacterium]
MTPSPDNINKQELWAEPDCNICVRLADGTVIKNLTPMSLFPLSEDNKNIVLLDENQQEVFYIDDLQQLESSLANDIQVALLRNRFILKLSKIRKVSSLRPPAEWKVLTDRGESSLVFSSEESIRRLPEDAALIQDSQGIRYLVTKINSLDSFSRKVIEYYI